MNKNSLLYDELVNQYGRRDVDGIFMTYQDIFNDFATRMPSFVDMVDKWWAAPEEYRSIIICLKDKKRYLYTYKSSVLIPVSR